MKFEIKTKHIILEFKEAPFSVFPTYLNIGFTWDFLHLDTGLPTKNETLKGVFAKNERGYRLNAIKKRF